MVGIGISPLKILHVHFLDFLSFLPLYNSDFSFKNVQKRFESVQITYKTVRKNVRKNYYLLNAKPFNLPM